MMEVVALQFTPVYWLFILFLLMSATGQVIDAIKTFLRWLLSDL